jgi:hypothetical protein
MAIAVPAVVVSTNDVISIENSLDSLFDIQKSTGQLPYAGRPFFDVLSFTYHLYTLIGVADHYLYTVSSPPVFSVVQPLTSNRATSPTSRRCGTGTKKP